MLRELVVSTLIGLGVLVGAFDRKAAADESRDPATRPALPSSASGAAASGPVFPIPGETRAEPHFAEGRYGAFRPGRKKRKDCGRGHCGIDLCASVGAAVMAVKDGIIAQIDRSTGGEGGRWIRVLHEDGTSTWYMHRARITEGLATGAAVKAGDRIASLGRTGVTTSPTHLHFALTIGAPGRETHLDPTGFLASAALVSAPFARPAPAAVEPGVPRLDPKLEKIRRSQRPEF